MILIRGKHAPSVAVDVGQSPMGSAPLSGIQARYQRLGHQLAGLARNVGHALSLPTRPALVLEMDNRVVRFNDPETFEFSLIPRTEFPVARIARLVHWPAEDLERMAAKIRRVEQRFAEVIAASVERPQIVGALLRRLSPKLFSQDHGWRELVAALNRCGSDFDVYKKIALVKYTQYLRSRQEVLRSFYFERTGSAPASPDVADGNADTDERRLMELRDTGLFEPGPAGGTLTREEFSALPRGETVCLRFNGSPEMPIRFSSHCFKLKSGKSFQLIDEYGTSYLIRSGKNLIGRHTDCDVVVEPFYRGVSRRHLIVEPVSETVALVTDLSSHGTYVPSANFRTANSS